MRNNKLYIYILIYVGTQFFLSCSHSAQSSIRKNDIVKTSAYVDNYILPAFFDSVRVQAHTRMPLEWIQKDSLRFYSVADNLAQLGVKVFTRHIKGGDEGAWWPSKIGAIAPPAKDVNIAKAVIENAHKNNQKIIVYHRHMEDDYFAEQHPDWMNRTPNGEKMIKKGIRLCLNSPFADAFLERALELIDLGADAFYFDEQHIPKEGCWCDYCRKGFEEETGLDMPKKIDLNDSNYLALQHYRNKCIERVFKRFRKEFHKRNPELVMLIASNNWPSMAGTHTSNRLYRIADIQKTEFHLPILATKSNIHPYKFPKEMKPLIDEVKMAHGWVLARDATGGRPPHVWVNRLLNESSALSATAALVGHGCIANLDHRESKIPDRMFKSSYSLGGKVSPYLASTKPYRWLALHYSEDARDYYWGNSYEAWKNVLYPHYGAYQSLMQERLPVGMITDSQLEDNLLEGYKILFITDKKNLTESMKESIRDFRSKGGHIIYNETEWEWHDEVGQNHAVNSFLKKVTGTNEIAPIKITGGSDAMQVDFFINSAKDKLTIACINDFSLVWTGRIDELKIKNPRKYKEIINRKPPKSCFNVQVELSGDLSKKPSRVFDAVSGESLQFYYSDGKMKIEVLEFDFLAMVVVLY